MNSIFTPTQLTLAIREQPVMTIAASSGDLSPAFHDDLAAGLLRAHQVISTAARAPLAADSRAHVQVYVYAEGGYRLRHSVHGVAEVQQLLAERQIEVPVPLRSAA